MILSSALPGKIHSDIKRIYCSDNNANRSLARAIYVIGRLDGLAGMSVCIDSSAVELIAISGACLEGPGARHRFEGLYKSLGCSVPDFLARSLSAGREMVSLE